MAVGRGEWFGVGLGASVQKLAYLPEAHTDFILAVIAEELGFVGVCAVIAAYALLTGRAFWIGLKCVEMRRHFAGYCAFGIALWTALQSFVSIGVNLRSEEHTSELQSLMRNSDSVFCLKKK